MTSEPEDAVWEPIEEQADPKSLAAERVPSLIHEPGLRQRGQRVEIVGTCDDETAQPWGFWGGAAALGALVAYVASRSAGYFGLRQVLVAMTIAAVGVALYRFGPQERRRLVELAAVDLERAQLTWATAATGPELVLDFDEISEIVFAMIYFPVSPSRPDARIHVFTLLVRAGDDDRLLPIIEASPDKGATWGIAQQLARLTGAPIAQVGEGVLGRG